MKKLVTPLDKRASETVTLEADATAYLGAGVTLLGVTSSSSTPSGLTLTNITINTTESTILGRKVPAGKALSLVVSAGSANGQLGQTYLVRVVCTTTPGVDVVELTIPVKVDDYPYAY